MSGSGPERVAVVGAGLMGAGIAQVFAASGHPVALYDPSEDALATAPRRVRSICELLGQDLSVAELVTPTSDLAAAAGDADLVVEAAPEDRALKRELFAALSQLARPQAILASNTSSIPIRDLAAGAADRSRVVGTHFWNPPYLVPLVEVVQSEETAASVVAAVVGLLEEVGMEPVHVRADIPGFVGNRLQHALKREAIALVASGVCDAETVDTVAKLGLGRRLRVLGPLEQSDLIGLDLTLAIHEVLMPSLDRTPAPHPFLVEKVRRGELGMKSGRGFREWSPEAADAVQTRLLEELLADRRRTARGTAGSPQAPLSQQVTGASRVVPPAE